LRHHFCVYVESACGIEDYDVVVFFLGVFDAVFCDLDGIGGVFSVNVDIRLLAEDNELLDGGWALEVSGDEDRSFAFCEEVYAELGGGCGFAAALEAGQHNYGWAWGDEVDAGIDGAHKLGELVVDYFYHHLAGVETFDYLSTNGGLGDILAELLDDIVVDIGFEQGFADFVHSVGDVCLGDTAPARERPEERIKFFC
jgi:hypothetical protein